MIFGAGFAVHGDPAWEVLSWLSAAAPYEILVKGRVPGNLSFWVLREWVNSSLVLGLILYGGNGTTC
jgi:hypothetical protein